MFASKIEGGSSIDISRKQVNWLKSLVYLTRTPLNSYSRTSRWWFDVKGPESEDYTYGVTVWPNGAGFVAKHMNHDEQYAQFEKDKESYREQILDCAKENNIELVGV